MHDADTLILENRYDLICLEAQITQELDNMVLSEGFIEDALQKAQELGSAAVEKGGQMISGAAQKGSDAIAGIASLQDAQQKIAQYYNETLPEYAKTLWHFIQMGAGVAAGGALVTWIIGKMFMWLGKKITTKDADNTDTNKLAIQLGVEDAARPFLDAIEPYKTSDPKKYNEMAFNIRKDVIKELKKSFQKKGKVLGAASLAKCIDIFGQFLTSAPGCIIGSLISLYFMHQLGYTMPSIPSLNLGTPQP